MKRTYKKIVISGEFLSRKLVGAGRYAYELLSELDNLLSEQSFKDCLVAGVCGRQIAYDNASKYERLVRGFNYPPYGRTWDKSDIEKLGIKAFFFSDACSAYRRDAYLAVEGFEKTATNEDMLIASKFIFGGYKLAYEATAMVYHSHNYNLKEEYKRNVAIGYFLESNKNRFSGVNVQGEGKSLVFFVVKNLLKKGYIISTIKFSANVLARILGIKHGKSLYREHVDETKGE